MSLAATKWARRQTVGSPIGKAVLLALADRSNGDHECWPSQDTLAEETEFSQRAVRGALKLLEVRGFIVRRKRGSRQRGRTSDRIKLAVDEVVGAAINRHIVPLNDLPAPQVDLPAPRAGESTKNLSIHRDETLYVRDVTLRDVDQDDDDADGPF